MHPLPDSAAFLGFNLNGPSLAVQVYDGKGERLAPTALELPSHVEGGPHRFLPKMGEMTAQILAESGLTWESITGVGVGIPAPIDDGVLLHTANLEHHAWENWPAAEVLSSYFEGKPVFVENDANAASYGEWRLLAEEKQRGLIAVATMGPGFGGALIENGHIIRGQGCAGEFGRVSITMNPYRYFRWGDWQYGGGEGSVTDTVEDFASWTALAAQLETIFGARDFDLLNQHPLREIGRTNTGRLDFKKMASHVPRFAETGDELCQQLFKLRAEAIGLLFSTIGLIADPHFFVLSGQMISETSESFRQDFAHTVVDHMKALLLTVKPYSVVPSVIGEEAFTYGAAMLIRDQVYGETVRRA